MLMLILSIIIIIVIVYIVFNIDIGNKIKNTIEKKIHPNKFFSKIYAICIPDRKEHIKNIMNDLRLNVELVDATLKKNLNLDELVSDGTITENYKKNKSTGKIACHLSHLKTIQMFLDDKSAKSCLIFEDDLKLPYDDNDTIDRMEDVIKDLPIDWDIVYFGRCWDKTCNKQKQIGKYLYTDVKPLCRHAYAISRNGGEIILNATLPMHKLNGDQTYLKLIYENKLNAFAVHPQLFNQNRENFKSDLENYDDLKECDTNKKKILKRRELNFSPKGYFTSKKPFLNC